MSEFKVILRNRRVSDEDLIKDVQRVADKIGQTVTIEDYEAHGKFHPTTLTRRFGSWFIVLEKCGLDATRSKLNIPMDELFENLANVWRALGRQPTLNDMSRKDLSTISSGTYEKRFKGWNNALLNFEQYISDPQVRFENLNGTELEKPSQRSNRKINWRLRAQTLLKDSCICRMCGASPAKDASVVLHVDHIKPWSKGGETVPENLQTLCQVCNIGKSDFEG